MYKTRVYFRIEEYCSVLTSHCMLHADQIIQQYDRTL